MNTGAELGMEMLKKQLAILLIVILAGMSFLGAWPLRAEAAYTFSGGGVGSIGDPHQLSPRHIHFQQV